MLLRGETVVINSLLPSSCWDALIKFEILIVYLA